ncbi:hypothetical protein U9M48_008769 [Paspalum notatum var. saurae]|uniref:DUF4218 domain-containing protein n=1 Tax=Paspalum notatum var. saurae TaxID=547442 RepID=A0AAQ3WDX8_PASNO
MCCLICMADTDAIILKHSGKVSFFDCHRRELLSRHEYRSDIGKAITKRRSSKRLEGEQVVEWLDELVDDDDGGFLCYGEEHSWTHKSCLWELPYAKALVLPYNIDVMHQERNISAKKDLVEICDRPYLEIQINSNGMESRPRAPYYLKPEDRKQILKWLQTLNQYKRAVNVSTGKLNGLKSHDYHIFMERLLPVMFRGYFDDELWKLFAELSNFYRQLCAKVISKKLMRELEKGIPVLLCQMEKIFPPGFFNVMEHLLVHLPWEALAGGPV